MNTRKWKCPNFENIEDHPDEILFTEKTTSSSIPPPENVMEFKVPRVEKCKYCKRSYTKTECVEV